MTEPHATDKSMVIAIYPNRHEAEIAKARLAEENIDTFITADDAGMMHPQLQLTQGVNLVARSDEAPKARQVLDATDLLPETPTDEEDYETEGTPLWRDLGTATMVIGIIVAGIGLVMGATTALAIGIVVALAGGIARWKLSDDAVGSSAST